MSPKEEPDKTHLIQIRVTGKEFRKLSKIGKKRGKPRPATILKQIALDEIYKEGRV